MASWRRAISGAGIARQMELPAFPAGALEVYVVKVEQCLPVQGLRASGKHGPEVHAIHGRRGQFGAGEPGDGGQHMHRGSDHVADSARWNSAWEARNERFPYASFQGAAFSTPVFAGAALIPRSVVAGRHYQDGA